LAWHDDRRRARGEIAWVMGALAVTRWKLLWLFAAIAGWANVAQAQQRPMPVIGFLNILSPATTQHFLVAFHKVSLGGGTLRPAARACRGARQA
jgi:hypothetical protein